jgi:UDP-glucose 4-epimerase
LRVLFGLKTASLRFGNIYGPRSGHKKSIIAQYIKQALNGNIIEIFGDGNQTRDFIFISDLVEAILLASSVNLTGEVVHIATSETSIKEIVENLKFLISTKEVFPPVRVKKSNPRVGEIKHNFSKSNKAFKLFGWTPKVTLEVGLRLTVDWFIRQKNVENQFEIGCE